MPRLIDAPPAPPCDLHDCVAALEARGFEPGDEESLHHAAHWLRRLGSNRHFLAELLVDRLKQRHRRAPSASAYGPQVITLSPLRGNVFLRANIWPSQQEAALRASGAASFAYGLPHDHNFSFLTHGYFGPGYWSDHYSYDYEALDGFTGEPAGLRFEGRRRLEPDSIMLYRAHRDIHAQYPPDRLSVSLNIMQRAPGQEWFDQYRFDSGADRIAAILNPGASEMFLRIALGLGSEEARDLAGMFARHHPSERMRLAAWEAQVGILTDPAERDALWRAAEGAGSRMVAMEAKARRRVIGEALTDSGIDQDVKL